MRPVPLLLCSSVLLALSACATAPLSAERLASTRAAIRSADEVGAARIPQAALLMRLANDELEQARLLAEAGDEERAELYLQRAKADAELALALTRQGEAQAEAELASAAVLDIEKVNP